MAKTYTHPHWETYVIDKSIYVPLNNEILPLFRPIFFCRTQKGPAGVPIWCDGLESAYKNFGEGTFDLNTKYFSREALYMSSIFNRQGCFITRMVSADAKYASLVLELRVKKTKITQYQKNSAGQFILDANTGKRVPLIENGLPVTEPGLELKWQIRKLEMGGIKKESITNLKPTTYGTGASSYTVYPIMAVRANYVGEYANGIGFKLFVDYENSDDVMMGNLGCIPYMFGLVQKTYGQDTVTAILSAFQNQFETVVLKPNQVDQRVAKNVSFADVIGNEFSGVMPFSVNLYSENIEIIGRLAMDVEKDDDTVFDPHMINLADLTNPEGVAYSHLVMSTEDDAIYLDDTRIMYLQGGEDGSISDSDIESLTSDYLLSGSVYPELMEQPRYPFTHIVDTGVSIQTKRAFIRFLGKHDAFKLILATQDAGMGRLNTKAEDLSVNKACGF